MIRIKRPSKKKTRDSLTKRLFAAGAAGVTMFTGGVLGVRASGAVKPPFAQVRLRTDPTAGAGRAPGASGTGATLSAEEEARIKSETERFLGELRKVAGETDKGVSGPRSFLARLLNISAAEAEGKDMNAAIWDLYSSGGLQDAVRDAIVNGGFTADQAAAALQSARIPESAIRDIAVNLGATPEQAVTYSQPAPAPPPPPSAEGWAPEPVPLPVASPAPSVTPSPPQITRIETGGETYQVPLAGGPITTASGAATPYTFEPSGQIVRGPAGEEIGRLQDGAFVPVTPAPAPGISFPAPQPAPPAPLPQTPQIEVGPPVWQATHPSVPGLRIDIDVNGNFRLPVNADFGEFSGATGHVDPNTLRYTVVSPQGTEEHGDIRSEGWTIAGVSTPAAPSPAPEPAAPPVETESGFVPRPTPAPETPAPPLLPESERFTTIAYGGTTYRVPLLGGAITTDRGEPTLYRYDLGGMVVGPTGEVGRIVDGQFVPTAPVVQPPTLPVEPVAPAGTRVEVDGQAFIVPAGEGFASTPDGRPTQYYVIAPRSGETERAVRYGGASGEEIGRLSGATFIPRPEVATPPPAPAPITIEIGGNRYQIDPTTLAVTKPAGDTNTYRVRAEGGGAYIIAVNGADTYRVDGVTGAVTTMNGQPLGRFTLPPQGQGPITFSSGGGLTPTSTAPTTPTSTAPIATSTTPTIPTRLLVFPRWRVRHPQLPNVEILIDASGNFSVPGDPVFGEFAGAEGVIEEGTLNYTLWSRTTGATHRGNAQREGWSITPVEARTPAPTDSSGPPPAITSPRMPLLSQPGTRWYPFLGADPGVPHLPAVSFFQIRNAARGLSFGGRATVASADTIVFRWAKVSGATSYWYSSDLTSSQDPLSNPFSRPYSWVRLDTQSGVQDQGDAYEITMPASAFPPGQHWFQITAGAGTPGDWAREDFAMNSFGWRPFPAVDLYVGQEYLAEIQVSPAPVQQIDFARAPSVAAPYQPDITTQFIVRNPNPVSETVFINGFTIEFTGPQGFRMDSQDAQYTRVASPESLTHRADVTGNTLRVFLEEPVELAPGSQRVLEVTVRLRRDISTISELNGDFGRIFRFRLQAIDSSGGRVTGLPVEGVSHQVLVPDTYFDRQRVDADFDRELIARLLQQGVDPGAILDGFINLWQGDFERVGQAVLNSGLALPEAIRLVNNQGYLRHFVRATLAHGLEPGALMAALRTAEISLADLRALQGYFQVSNAEFRTLLTRAGFNADAYFATQAVVPGFHLFPDTSSSDASLPQYRQQFTRLTLKAAYFVPTDQPVDPLWQEAIEAVMQDTANFYRRELRGAAEVTYEVFPQPVRAEHPDQYYRTDGIHKIVQERVRRMHRAGGDLYDPSRSARALDEYDVLVNFVQHYRAGAGGPMYVSRDVLQRSDVPQGGLFGGATRFVAAGDFARFLDERRAGEVLPGMLHTVAHEVGHGLGLPHSWERIDNPSDPRLLGEFRAVGGDMMGAYSLIPGDRYFISDYFVNLLLGNPSVAAPVSGVNIPHGQLEPAAFADYQTALPLDDRIVGYVNSYSADGVPDAFLLQALLEAVPDQNAIIRSLQQAPGWGMGRLIRAARDLGVTREQIVLALIRFGFNRNQLVQPLVKDTLGFTETQIDELIRANDLGQAVARAEPSVFERQSVPEAPAAATSAPVITPGGREVNVRINDAIYRVRPDGEVVSPAADPNRYFINADGTIRLGSREGQVVYTINAQGEVRTPDNQTVGKFDVPRAEVVTDYTAGRVDYYLRKAEKAGQTDAATILELAESGVSPTVIAERALKEWGGDARRVAVAAAEAGAAPHQIAEVLRDREMTVQNPDGTSRTVDAFTLALEQAVEQVARVPESNQRLQGMGSIAEFLRRAGVSAQEARDRLKEAGFRDDPTPVLRSAGYAPNALATDFPPQSSQFRAVNVQGTWLALLSDSGTVRIPSSTKPDRVSPDSVYLHEGRIYIGSTVLQERRLSDISDTDLIRVFAAKFQADGLTRQQANAKIFELAIATWGSEPGRILRAAREAGLSAADIVAGLASVDESAHAQGRETHYLEEGIMASLDAALTPEARQATAEALIPAIREAGLSRERMSELTENLAPRLNMTREALERLIGIAPQRRLAQGVRIELDVPEYLPDYLRQPQRIFVGRTIKIVSQVAFTSESVSLTSEATGRTITLVAERAEGGDRALTVQIPRDTASGRYRITVEVAGMQQEVPLQIYNDEGFRKTGVAVNPPLAPAEAAAITYRASLTQENSYEFVFAGHPTDSNKLVFVGGGDEGHLKRSTDGGRTWSSTTISEAARYPASLEVVYRGDPAIATTQDGSFFLASDAFMPPQASSKQAVIGGFLYHGSYDGDLETSQIRGFPEQSTVSSQRSRTPLEFDRPTIAVDERSSTVYVSSSLPDSDLEGHRSILYVSRDGGRSFEKKYPDNRGGGFSSMTVGVDGTLYATSGGDWETNRLQLLRFRSFEPIAYDSLSFPGRANGVDIARLSSVSDRGWSVDRGPRILADTSEASPHRGRLYIVWAEEQQLRDGGPTFEYHSYGYNHDVFTSYSDDRGETWSTPVRVNDDIGSGDQVFPSARLDANGTLHVVFLDHRNNQDREVFDVYYAKSTDGIRFSRNLRVNQNPIPNSGGRDVGDYLDMVMPYPDRVYIVYPDAQIVPVGYPAVPVSLAAGTAASLVEVSSAALDRATSGADISFTRWGTDAERQETLRQLIAAGMSPVGIIQALDAADQQAQAQGRETHYLGEGIMAALEAAPTPEARQATAEALIPAIREAGLSRERISELIENLAPRLNMTREALERLIGGTGSSIARQRVQQWERWRFLVNGVEYTFSSRPITSYVAGHAVTSFRVQVGGSDTPYWAAVTGIDQFDIEIESFVVGHLSLSGQDGSGNKVGVFTPAFQSDARGLVRDSLTRQPVARLIRQADNRTALVSYRPLRGTPYLIPDQRPHAVLGSDGNPLLFWVGADNRITGVEGRFFGRIVGDAFRPAYTAWVRGQAFDIDFDPATGRGEVYANTPRIGTRTDYTVTRSTSAVGSYEVKDASGTVIAVIDGSTGAVSAGGERVGYVQATDFAQVPLVHFVELTRGLRGARPAGSGLVGATFSRASLTKQDAWGSDPSFRGIIPREPVSPTHPDVVHGLVPPPSGTDAGAPGQTAPAPPESEQPPVSDLGSESPPTSAGATAPDAGAFSEPAVPAHPDFEHGLIPLEPATFSAGFSNPYTFLFNNPGLAAAAGLQPGTVTAGGALVPFVNNDGSLYFEFRAPAPAEPRGTEVPINPPLPAIASPSGETNLVAQLPAPISETQITAALPGGVTPESVNTPLVQEAFDVNQLTARPMPAAPGTVEPTGAEAARPGSLAEWINTYFGVNVPSGTETETIRWGNAVMELFKAGTLNSPVPVRMNGGYGDLLSRYDSNTDSFTIYQVDTAAISMDSPRATQRQVGRVDQNRNVILVTPDPSGTTWNYYGTSVRGGEFQRNTNELWTNVGLGDTLAYNSAGGRIVRNGQETPLHMDATGTIYRVVPGGAPSGADEYRPVGWLSLGGFLPNDPYSASTHIVGVNGTRYQNFGEFLRDSESIQPAQRSTNAVFRGPSGTAAVSGIDGVRIENNFGGGWAFFSEGATGPAESIGAPAPRFAISGADVWAVDPSAARDYERATGNPWPAEAVPLRLTSYHRYGNTIVDDRLGPFTAPDGTRLSGTPVWRIQPGEVYRLDSPGFPVAHRDDMRQSSGSLQRQAVGASSLGRVNVSGANYFFERAPADMTFDSAGGREWGRSVPHGIYTGVVNNRLQGESSYRLTLGSLELPDGVHQVYLVHQGQNPNIAGYIDRSEETQPDFSGRFSAFTQSTAVLTADGTIRDTTTGGILQGISQDDIFSGASVSVREVGQDSVPQLLNRGGVARIEDSGQLLSGGIASAAVPFSHQDIVQALAQSLPLSQLGHGYEGAPNLVGFTMSVMHSPRVDGVLPRNATMLFASAPVPESVSGRIVVRFNSVKALLLEGNNFRVITIDPQQLLVRYDVAQGGIAYEIPTESVREDVAQYSRMVLGLPGPERTETIVAVFQRGRSLLTDLSDIRPNLLQTQEVVRQLRSFGQQQNITTGRPLAVQLLVGNDPSQARVVSGTDQDDVIVFAAAPLQSHTLLTFAHEFSHHLSAIEDNATYNALSQMIQTNGESARAAFIADVKRFVGPERRADVFAASVASELVLRGVWTRDEALTAIRDYWGISLNGFSEIPSFSFSQYLLDMHDPPSERQRTMRYAFDFYLRHPELLGGPLVIPASPTGRIQSRISKTAVQRSVRRTVPRDTLVRVDEPRLERQDLVLPHELLRPVNSSDVQGYLGSAPSEVATQLVSLISDRFQLGASANHSGSVALDDEVEINLQVKGQDVPANASVWFDALIPSKFRYVAGSLRVNGDLAPADPEIVSRSPFATVSEENTQVLRLEHGVWSYGNSTRRYSFRMRADNLGRPGNLDVRAYLGVAPQLAQVAGVGPFTTAERTGAPRQEAQQTTDQSSAVAGYTFTQTFSGGPALSEAPMQAGELVAGAANQFTPTRALELSANERSVVAVRFRFAKQPEQPERATGSARVKYVVELPAGVEYLWRSAQLDGAPIDVEQMRTLPEERTASGAKRITFADGQMQLDERTHELTFQVFTTVAPETEVRSALRAELSINGELARVDRWEPIIIRAARADTPRPVAPAQGDRRSPTPPGSEQPPAPVTPPTNWAPTAVQFDSRLEVSPATVRAGERLSVTAVLERLDDGGPVENFEYLLTLPQGFRLDPAQGVRMGFTQLTPELGERAGSQTVKVRISVPANQARDPSNPLSGFRLISSITFWVQAQADATPGEKIFVVRFSGDGLQLVIDEATVSVSAPQPEETARFAGELYTTLRGEVARGQAFSVGLRLSRTDNGGQVMGVGYELELPAGFEYLPVSAGGGALLNFSPLDARVTTRADGTQVVRTDPFVSPAASSFGGTQTTIAVMVRAKADVTEGEKTFVGRVSFRDRQVFEQRTSVRVPAANQVRIEPSFFMPSSRVEVGNEFYVWADLIRSDDGAALPQLEYRLTLPSGVELMPNGADVHLNVMQGPFYQPLDVRTEGQLLTATIENFPAGPSWNTIRLLLKATERATPGEQTLRGEVSAAGRALGAATTTFTVEAPQPLPQFTTGLQAPARVSRNATFEARTVFTRQDSAPLSQMPSYLLTLPQGFEYVREQGVKFNNENPSSDSFINSWSTWTGTTQVQVTIPQRLVPRGTPLNLTVPVRVSAAATLGARQLTGELSMMRGDRSVQLSRAEAQVEVAAPEVRIESRLAVSQPEVENGQAFELTAYLTRADEGEAVENIEYRLDSPPGFELASGPDAIQWNDAAISLDPSSVVGAMLPGQRHVLVVRPQNIPSRSTLEVNVLKFRLRAVSAGVGEVQFVGSLNVIDPDRRELTNSIAPITVRQSLRLESRLAVSEAQVTAGGVFHLSAVFRRTDSAEDIPGLTYRVHLPPGFQVVFSALEGGELPTFDGGPVAASPTFPNESGQDVDFHPRNISSAGNEHTMRFTVRAPNNVGSYRITGEFTAEGGQSAGSNDLTFEVLQSSGPQLRPNVYGPWSAVAAGDSFGLAVNLTRFDNGDVIRGLEYAIHLPQGFEYAPAVVGGIEDRTVFFDGRSVPVEVVEGPNGSHILKIRADYPAGMTSHAFGAQLRATQNVSVGAQTILTTFSAEGRELARAETSVTVEQAPAEIAFEPYNLFLSGSVSWDNTHVARPDQPSVVDAYFMRLDTGGPIQNFEYRLVIPRGFAYAPGERSVLFDGAPVLIRDGDISTDSNGRQVVSVRLEYPSGRRQYHAVTVKIRSTQEIATGQSVFVGQTVVDGRVLAPQFTATINVVPAGGTSGGGGVLGAPQPT